MMRLNAIGECEYGLDETKLLSQVFDTCRASPALAAMFRLLLFVLQHHSSSLRRVVGQSFRISLIFLSVKVLVWYNKIITINY